MKFFLGFFAYCFLKVRLHHFSKQGHEGVARQWESRFFLLILLDVSNLCRQEWSTVRI